MIAKNSGTKDRESKTVTRWRSQVWRINAVSKPGQLPVFRITKAYGDPQM